MFIGGMFTIPSHGWFMALFYHHYDSMVISILLVKSPCSYGFPMFFPSIWFFHLSIYLSIHPSIYQFIIHPTVQQVTKWFISSTAIVTTVLNGPSTAFQQHWLTLGPCGHVGTAQHVQQLRTPWGTRWSKGLACWRWWIASQGTDLGVLDPAST